jgi:hypothetical protein
MILGMTRAALLVAAVALTGTAAADPAAKPPRWTKLPSDKWRCSRYAPLLGSPKQFTVHAPAGKPVIFTMGAASRDKTKITYSADGLPAGAIVDPKTGRFTWQIPKDATGSSQITLIATTSKGAEIRSPFTLTIADPRLVAAWRAGMGSFEPDCQHQITGFSFEDLDGDGTADLLYTDGDEQDDSANSGSYVQHVRRGIGEKFDAIDRALPNGSLSVETTPDGKRVVVIESSCCCQASLTIFRITPTGADQLLSAGGEDCRGYTAIEVERGAKGIEKVHTQSGDDDAPTKQTHVWRRGRYELK